MAEQPTTIAVSSRTRDRLRAHGFMGETYDDILERMMDRFDRDRYLDGLRREIDAPGADWVDLEDMGWVE